MGWLHRLPDHVNQIGAERVQVCFVAQLGREGLEGFTGVVLTAVEATVYERLEAKPQRCEQRGDHQGGGYGGELALLTGECAKGNLVYQALELLLPKLAADTMLLADNVLSHPEEISGYLEAVGGLDGFDRLILPVGKGLSVAYRGPAHPREHR